MLWDYQAASILWKMRVDPVDAGRDPNKDALTLKFELEHVRNTSSYQIANDSLGNWVNYEQKQESSPLWIFKRDLNQAVLFSQEKSRLVRLEDVDTNDLHFAISLQCQLKIEETTVHAPDRNLLPVLADC